MSFKTEIAKTSRGKCSNCKKSIEREEVKLVYEGQGYNFPIKRSYCKKCGRNIIEEEIKQLNDILKELK